MTRRQHIDAQRRQQQNKQRALWMATALLIVSLLALKAHFNAQQQYATHYCNVHSCATWVQAQ